MTVTSPVIELRSHLNSPSKLEASSHLFAFSTVNSTGDFSSLGKISIMITISMLVVLVNFNSSFMSSVIVTGTLYVPSICTYDSGFAPFALSLNMSVRVLMNFCQLSEPVLLGVKLAPSFRRSMEFPEESSSFTLVTSLSTLLMKLSLLNRMPKTLFIACC